MGKGTVLPEITAVIALPMVAILTELFEVAIVIVPPKVLTVLPEAKKVILLSNREIMLVLPPVATVTDCCCNIHNGNIGSTALS